MSFIVWTHDPCYEGGWHIHVVVNTWEEALAAAEQIHAHEEAICQDGGGCYDKTMITSGSMREWQLKGHESTEK